MKRCQKCRIGSKFVAFSRNSPHWPSLESVALRVTSLMKPCGLRVLDKGLKRLYGTLEEGLEEGTGVWGQFADRGLPEEVQVRLG